MITLAQLEQDLESIRQQYTARIELGASKQDMAYALKIMIEYSLAVFARKQI